MIRAVLTILFITFTTLGVAQTDQKKQLEQKKAQILKEISGFRSLLSKENSREKSVLTKISESEAKIRLNEKLIQNTKKQTKILTDEIYLNQLKINKLNRELKVLKEDYAAMIVKAYKSRSQQSRIMFILSSQNFLQAYKRMQYMKQYANFRKIQGEAIKAKKAELEVLAAKLNAQKVEKEALLAENLKVKAELEEEKKEQEKLIKSIQKDKKKYIADIRNREKEAKAIERKIDKIVRDAIAAANKKTAASGATKASKGSKSTAEPNKIVLTKEGKIVADNFNANKGKLPWPVEKGYMSMRYGKQRSPLAPNVEIDHGWIEITTEEGAKARSIFQGEVIDVQIISGLKSVFVQHGNYITVYGGLISTDVSTGDKVVIKQSLGNVYTNPISGKTIVKFSIFKNTTKLDPQYWITPL
ncbi:murein hydrolase activator EnvC family protein [Flavobacterium litorale]|uniref:Peptidoglycan DD-metalloendopeptidase family protein n=1 Tax=Flavobacterium litorale TaxID=2856519 RepID=A0ABX8VAE2_9FLAO|nr:peptidoglycan DD-metalloendopeptidase family protein [Flavobacterium litorale]QYJ69098.1 peptidoglycan DD-metalloendopeptidase family protein [Flavobacterium litorale]